MRNLLLTLSFDGSAYHGWQIQPNAVTVQQVFQDALIRVLGERPNLKGCSRTDSGVHAHEFCISLNTDRPIPCARLTAALNHFLPPDLAVLSCMEVPLDFHARYSCTGKEYVYKIWNAPIRNPFLRSRALHCYDPLDVQKMDQAARCFLGKHDFTSFCTLDGRKAGDLCRTVTRSEVLRDGDFVTYVVAADGFLYNMVRILTGTLLSIARGALLPETLPAILEARDRAAAGPTAPPQGLYLNRVFYPFAPYGMHAVDKNVIF